MVLGHLGGQVFLPLKQGSDVVLKLDKFAGDGFGWVRANEAAAEGASENSGAENGNIA